ncbi:hypothetical protein ACF0H5_014622 [Mactra antiquata]
MSDVTFDFECTACERNNKSSKAVKYCHDCGGYCCQTCTDTHKMFQALENHALADITLASQPSHQQPKQLQYPTERCSVHEGKLIDMYCEHHNDVGCYMCLLKHHRSCPESHIHCIPEMIDTLFKLTDSKHVQNLLRERMLNLQNQRKVKTSQLNMLLESKKFALEEVMSFHKALLACIDKMIETSKGEIEDSYEELRKQADEEKHAIDIVYGDLKKADDKLKGSDKNKAQQFVCTKIADGFMKTADRAIEEKTKAKMGEVSFVPNFTILKHIESQVKLGVTKKITDVSTELYIIQNTKDICINIDGDASHSWCNGCCINEDGNMLVTDYFNKKVKRIDLAKGDVVDSCKLDSHPYVVCCTRTDEFAVGCQGINEIQFLSVKDKKMKVTRQMEISHLCSGIAFMNDRLYMTDAKETLRIYNMNGTLMKEVSCDNDGQKLFTCCRHLVFNKSGTMLFVADDKYGLVCFDQELKFLHTISDVDLRGATGVCIDGKGNVFATGYSSNSIVQFREYGEKVGVLMKEADGLKKVVSVCFHPNTSSCIVAMNNPGVLKMCCFRKRHI